MEDPCVGLKKTISHGLGYLNTWFPVGRAIWEGLNDTALLEEYISVADFDVIQLTLLPIHSLICASNGGSELSVPAAVPATWRHH